MTRPAKRFSLAELKGDDHLPTLEFGSVFSYFSCGFRRVGVVETEEPAGMLAEPPEHGRSKRIISSGWFHSGKLRTSGLAKRRKICAQVDRGANTEQRADAHCYNHSHGAQAYSTARRALPTPPDP